MFFNQTYKVDMRLWQILMGVFVIHQKSPRNYTGNRMISRLKENLMDHRAMTRLEVSANALVPRACKASTHVPY